MNKRRLVAFTVIAAGILMVSGALADTGDVAYEKVQALVATGHNSGNTAGTILNPEGRGDILIFPYYDVREINGKTQDFYFALINDESECENTTGYPNVECNAGMAAKLRFREWDKGEEVFSTDIWLSRGDVWVGVLTHNTTLAYPYGARITSPDFVITDFSVNNFTLSTPLMSGVDFANSAIIPPGSDNLMGYFEVIGEERTYDKLSNGKVTRVTTNVDAPNSLMGYAYIVRVADGQSFAYNATAIANFSKNQGSLFSGVGSASPTLMDGEDTLDQLEFQLSKKEVFAGYTLEDTIAGKFSLVLTFPTKQFHFCPEPNYTIKGDVTAPCTADYPLGSPFNPTLVSWVGYGYFPPGPPGPGERINLNLFDRNEYRLSDPVCFLSACPIFVPPGLPWGVNVIGLYKGWRAPTVPAAGARDNVAFSTGPFESGYIRVNFPNTGQGQPLNPKITRYLNFDFFRSGYEGLPVIGLSLQEFQNSDVGGFYGDTRDVFYRTQWVTP